MKLILTFLLILLSLPVLAGAKLSFSGVITLKSLAKLEDKVLKAIPLLMDNDRVILIDLDSGGGDLFATLSFIDRMKIASKNLNFSIYTRVKSSCESSCTVLFTVGSERLAGKRAHFGFHSPAIASRVPRGISRKLILENARARWMGAISSVDERLALELETRRLLYDDDMVDIRARELLTGYVTAIE